MSDPNFQPLANETLNTFEEISDCARTQLAQQQSISGSALAYDNSLTSLKARENLDQINRQNQDFLEALTKEPAIARLVLEDSDGNRRSIFIARNSNGGLSTKTEFASYGSELGRLAEIPVGDDRELTLGGIKVRYYVVENTSFVPTRKTGEWDSSRTIYRNDNDQVYTLESLRALLPAPDLDSADELDRILEQAESQQGISAGISHQVRTAMGLRDQPILDQFQGEIFRLPLDSQLMILGPPGTGKTTTLIKRLGQKLSFELLDEDEKRMAETAGKDRPHAANWLMFTPSELLKHYLKEAFSREQVPASDDHIRTWTSYRNAVARNTLGILRTANGGKFSLKVEVEYLQSTVIEDPRNWFVALRDFHEARLRKQLQDGVEIVAAAANDEEGVIAERLASLSDTIERNALIDTYRALDAIEDALKEALAGSKAIADELLKKERNRLFNSDKEVFARLAKHLETLQEEAEADDEEEFDDDEQEESSGPTSSAIQTGVKAYQAALRALARNKYLKRSMPKSTRSGSVIRFLGDAVPANDVLQEVGRHISFQNGLRRFIHSHRRYVADVVSSYTGFRKDKANRKQFYLEETGSALQISPIELDAIVLLMLRNSRELLKLRFVSRSLGDAKFTYLTKVTGLFRCQIMVDEATDFSLLQLANMAALTAPDSQSFFACGDFNQRITTTGIRHTGQLEWISPTLSTRTVRLVYRQSRKLNAFAESLLRLQGGDLSALGQVPEESKHDGVEPVLSEHRSEADMAHWIAQRIKEVENSAGILPTIAVLVNNEQQVKPMAERLNRHLEDVNLSAVACEEGMALGEGTDVRVFDIQHIKGLEFEAVFFTGIDQLAQDMPELFSRFLYVGATRAATYLGLTCSGALPTDLEPLREHFGENWDF